MRKVIFTLLLFLSALHPAFAQEVPKPFIMPLAAPASPSTWLLGQPYGNTVGAYNFGTQWYSAGQGLHFGVDISMPCGTPLVAVADGDVIYADNLAFGAGPHNLILRHQDAGVTTLYGHLLDRPPVQQFQPVRQGEIVGYSGDPDVTCDSRPHLHFEVRSLDYQTAYNPVDYIQANWDALAAIGPFNTALFQQDLTNPRQWMYLDDQPPVVFGGARLNAYSQTWPPNGEERPPANAVPMREFTPLPSATWKSRPLTMENCCPVYGWNPLDANHLYTIDGPPGQTAAVFEWEVATGSLLNLVGQAPLPFLSPDGSHQISKSNGQVTIRRLSDAAQWNVPTAGFLPALSPDNRRLVWTIQYGQFVPGAVPPQVEIWISDSDGANARLILGGTRLSPVWLDNTRLLISQTENTLTTLNIYNADDGSSVALGTWNRLRGLSPSPGGQWLLFYQTFQPDPGVNAVYALQTQPGALPQPLPWFGAWRWRDAESLYYIPFQPDQPTQSLAYYHIPSGENRLLTDAAALPFLIANGDWSVSPDAQRILFQNKADHRLWLLEPG